MKQRDFSTYDILVSVQENKALDLGLLPAAILLGIKKVFIDHEILIGKLEHIRVRREA